MHKFDTLISATVYFCMIMKKCRKLGPTAHDPSKELVCIDEKALAINRGAFVVAPVSCARNLDLFNLYAQVVFFEKKFYYCSVLMMEFVHWKSLENIVILSKG